jgi:hypothetical protein
MTYQLYWRDHAGTLGATCHAWRWLAALHAATLRVRGMRDVELIECEAV